ncbi:VOC family protein [Mycolicibacterium vaccae]|uniref:VOC family protein n=1 Tax=Mycolicibacterium vaccae TaxID=1810 RepID=UPI003CF57E92
MPVRTTTPLGAPIWIDLSTSDLERSQQFYGTVFGWTFESSGPEYGGYVTAFRDGRPVAGLMANDPQWNAPDAWTTYLHTADIAATLTQTTSAGGTNCVPAMEIPGKGWMAMATDPAGAFFGLWQPTGHRGYEVVNEHGAPLYFQLTTRDYGAALDFYRSVFGWQTNTVADSDEFRYSTASFDGEELLGVMDGSVLPEEVPSVWTMFLAADDVDKTVRLVTENGGSVVRAAEDTPYGRLAALTDPTGAAFNLSSIEG